MATTADFRNGMVMKMENGLMQIVEFQHVKPGKGGAFVRTKLKNVITGRILEKTFRSGERVEDVKLESVEYQYLYREGDIFHFMDNETYEQLVVGADIIGDGAKWLKENTNVQLTFHEGKVILANIPLFAELTITQCDPGVQGDRAQGGTKPATLETGAVIQVPLFVGEGEKIKVDTRTGDYIERVSS
jgi:elongation factor P